MGRAHEVRAKAMAATAAKRSALFMRASKEIYMAAKSGEPDPAMNLALRSAIEKWRGQNVTKDVIDRAIQKAKGGSAEAYTAGRYEAFGPGGSLFIVDTLTDNTNRALTEVRTAITKKGGHLGSVIFNFSECKRCFSGYGNYGVRCRRNHILTKRTNHHYRSRRSTQIPRIMRYAR